MDGGFAPIHDYFIVTSEAQIFYMATINSVSSSFVLSPQNLLYDHDKYQWMRTECILSVSIKEQALLLHPAPYLCLQRHDFKLLIDGVRKFLEQLSKKESPNDRKL